MTDPTILLDLAHRCEQAAGPDRVLDDKIHGALGYCLHPHTERSGAQSDTGFTCTTCGADSWGNKGPRGERLYGSTQPYTSSLDEAITLYPALPDLIPSCPRKASAAALRAMAAAQDEA
jgi:hypothetical protein